MYVCMYMYEIKNQNEFNLQLKNKNNDIIF